MPDTLKRPVFRGGNPLRDPRDRRLNRIAGPSSLVLFGVTGDLARKKLMPAVYDLANRGLLPPSFALVGFGRRGWDNEEFAAELGSRAYVMDKGRVVLEQSPGAILRDQAVLHEYLGV